MMSDGDGDDDMEEFFEQNNKNGFHHCATLCHHKWGTDRKDELCFQH